MFFSWEGRCNFIKDPLYTMSCFSFIYFKILFFQQFDYSVFIYVSYWTYLVGLHWVSWMWWLIFKSNLGSFQPLLLQISFQPLFVSLLLLEFPVCIFEPVLAMSHVFVFCLSFFIPFSLCSSECTVQLTYPEVFLFFLLTV